MTRSERYILRLAPLMPLFAKNFPFPVQGMGSRYYLLKQPWIGFEDILNMARTFIALDIPFNCRKLIKEHVTAWRSHQADVRWVDPDNLHLTIKFLGEVPENRLEPVLSACKAVAETHKDFSLCLSGTGAFPDAANPRVLWVGIKGDLSAMSGLQFVLDLALEEKGFTREVRPFLPHLTTGRVRSRRRITEFMESYLKDGIESASFIVNEITVYRSELTGSGPLYHQLAGYHMGLYAAS